MPRPDWPTAAPFVPPTGDLTVLAAAMDGCRGCPLWEPATQAVPGSGPETARVVLVGEQPGDQEDLQGRPFVGPAGRLLDSALDEAGVDRAQAYVTNAVKHFKFRAQGKRRVHASPDTWEVRACTPWLQAEMALLKPEVVVLLGATAGKAVYGASFRVGEARGRLADFPPELPGHHQPAHAPRWVLATTHPAAVLRSRERDADYERFVADLRVATEALKAAG